MPGVSPVLTGDEFPIPYGMLPVRQDEHAALPRQGPLRRRSGGGRRGARRGDGVDGPGLIEVEYEPLRRSPRPRRASRTPSRGSTTTPTKATCHKRCRLAVRRRRRGARRAPTSLRGRVLLPGQHPPARSSSTPRSRGGTPTASSRSGRAPRRRTTCTGPLAKVLGLPPSADPRHGHAERRRLRRQERPLQPRDRRRQAALVTDRPVKICLTREEVFYCHRGRHPVLMRFQTGVTQRRRHHRHALPRRCSTAAPTGRTAWRAPSIPARSRR